MRGFAWHQTGPSLIEIVAWYCHKLLDRDFGYAFILQPFLLPKIYGDNNGWWWTLCIGKYLHRLVLGGAV